MRFGYRRTLPLFLGMLLACAVAAVAQSHPPVTTRQAIVTALNNALGSSGTSVTLNNVELYDELENGCKNVDPLELEIEYHTSEGFFILKRKMLSSSPLSGVPLVHPLVEDLNAWLNKVWLMDLTNIPEFYDLSWACSNPSQRYFTRGTTNDSVIAALQEETGERAMLDKYYNINGVMKKGSEILHFSDVTPREVRYITDLGGAPDSTRVRYLAGFYLKVQCDSSDSSNYVAIKLNVETSNYDTDSDGDFDEDCGLLKQQLLNIELTTENINSQCAILIGGGTADALNRGALDTLLRLRNHFGTPSEDWTNTTTPVDTLGRFAISNTGYIYFQTFESPKCTLDSILLCKVMEVETSDEYCEVAYCLGGTFSLDQHQRLIYTPPVGTCSDACTAQPVPCIQFCDYADIQMPTVAGVIQADARTFADETPLLPATLFPAAYPMDTPNLFETGDRGKWRPVDEYIYRTSIKPGSGQFNTNLGAASERTYNDAGVFNLQLFGWDEAANDPTKWLNTTTVTRYSQNGDAVEENDIFDIPSAARFGYRQQLPILVAKNATYGSVWFESFEGDVADNTSSNGEVVATEGHSGAHSYKLPVGAWSDPLDAEFVTDAKAQTDGLLLRIWTKITYPTGSPTVYDKICPFRFRLRGSTNYTVGSPQFKYIAKTGEWSLYEGVIASVTPGIYTIEASALYGDIDTWIDDIRIQPQKSEMVCYVYDPITFRQTVMFDDQHFGAFYQYNAEGKLIRTIRETMKGRKTTQEVQYHTPLLARNYASSNVTFASAPQGGSFGGPSMSILGGGSGDSSGSGGMKANLLDVELGLEKRDVKVLGVDIDKLGEKIEEMKKLIRIPSIDSLDLPDLDKLRLVDELETIDGSLDQLAGSMRGDTDQVKLEARRQAIRAATERRAELLRKLGLSEEEGKELIERVRAMKTKIEAEEPDSR